MLSCQETNTIIFEFLSHIRFIDNYIGGVIVSVLASNAVHHGFELRSGQTKNYKIGVCCFAASTIKIQLSVLVLYKADIIILSMQLNLFSP